MQFRCNAAPKAVPCIRISTHDDTGKLLAKPKRHYKPVRNGELLNAVPDRCSRKHFTAVDAEARKLNDDDYRAMLAEMNDILAPHGKTVPKGTTFSTIADSLAKIEYDSKKKQEAERPDLLTIPEATEPAVEPVTEDEPIPLAELTNRELKALCDGTGKEYPAVVNKAQLLEILADKDK